MDDPTPHPRPRPRPSPGPLPALPPDPPEPAQARFVPDRRYTALAAGGAFGALIAAVATSDAGGRLLLGLAAAVLAGYVACDLLFSPRLSASTDGIVVNSPVTRVRLSWNEVDAVRAETRIRHGLRNTTLEVDGGAVLVVLSRRALGADPVEVAELVEAFRPR